jgi:hypothetical protein
MKFTGAAATTPLLTNLDYIDICDLRIYDHALSVAEVKELSSALIVHYTFDDVLAEPTTNIISGIASVHGKAFLESGRVKINWSPSGADSYFMFNCTQTIKANSVYTLSFDCEGLKASEVATFAVNNLGSAYTIALENGRNSLTFTAGSDLMDAIVSANNYLFFDDKTRTEGAVFYLSNFQLEEKDHATPYTPSTRASMIRNEAETIQPTTVSNIILTTDAASGGYSLKCAESTYLKHTPAGDGSNATASFWLKNFDTSGQMVVFADANSKLAFGPYSTYSCISCQSGVASQVMTSEINKYWKTADWNHVVVRKNSSNEYSCFINGTKVANTTGDHWTHDTYLSVGCRISSNVVGR